ncbi:MAG: tetratricopeptide repeat protein [Phycisphaerae bacterium]|nr:tetratricopeptide repeat protein [Phycisphaerae bacterium]
MTSPHVLLHFRLKEGAKPLTGIDLYFTTDDGETWKKSKAPKGVDSPVAWDAPADGAYGFYLQFHTAEASSSAPTKGTRPQRCVRVDTTAPVVQLLTLKPDKRFDLTREVAIRWRAEDADLADRPVSIRFRTERTKTFRLIEDSLPAEGLLRWSVPEGDFGRIELKLSATDRAGNRGDHVDDRLRVSDAAAELAMRSTAESQDEMAASSVNSAASAERRGTESGDATGETPTFSPMSDPDSGERLDDSGAAREAKRQYDLATWHRLRGETAVAVVKYREALRLRPDLAAARNDLAAVLYLRGELDDAEAEYGTILQADPGHRSAMKGLALVQARKRNYRSAHTTLEKLLLLDPADAEAWMNFGDVSLFMGDRSAARDAWKKAMDSAGASKELKARVAKRLEIYKVDGFTLSSEAE